MKLARLTRNAWFYSGPEPGEGLTLIPDSPESPEQIMIPDSPESPEPQRKEKKSTVDSEPPAKLKDNPKKKGQRIITKDLPIC